MHDRDKGEQGRGSDQSGDDPLLEPVEDVVEHDRKSLSSTAA
jgi:hypothetical protein